MSTNNVFSQTYAVERMMRHMLIVAHEYLMLFYVLTADTRCCTLAYHADLYPGPQLQKERPMNLKLSQICTVLHDVHVSEFVQNICPLTGLLTTRATARQ